MRWLHFCLLITLLPLFSASSSQAQQDYTGVWAGTTSQNETITMVVSGRTLQAVVVRVHIQGGEPDWCTGQVLFLASNFDTGLYYMDGPAIELFWEQEGAQLTLGALIDQDQAHGTVNLATTSSRHPPVCQGVGSADFTAGNGAPYAGGRAPRPTAPPPPPPPTTQPDTGPRPTARPTQVGQPTTGPQPSPTDTIPFGGTTCDPAYANVCIPPPSEVGDLNCPEIEAQYGCGVVEVVSWPDPHGLDREGDGIACECDER
jgi:hypothetical protein